MSFFSFFRRPPKPSRKEFLFRSPEIVFLGEQDGIPEREFKSQCLAIISTYPDVAFAYLARVHYGNPDKFNVAICLNATTSCQEDVKVALGKVFANTFNAREHLDLVFVSEEQAARLAKVCRPFYTNGK